MDTTFATYDEAASDLQEPAKFWKEVDDILCLDGPALRQESDGNGRSRRSDPSQKVNPSLLRSQLTNFFALCDGCYDTHLDQSANRDDVLGRLVESPLLAHASIADVSDILISLVTCAKTLPMLHLLFGALLALGFRHSTVYRSSLATTQLIPRLVHHFWAARYAEEYIVKEGGNREAKGDEYFDWNIKHVRAISMGDSKKQMEQARDRTLQCKLRDESVLLLYEVCRAQRLHLKDMRAIDATFINHLFDLVEASRHWHDDTYNYQLIKLIVALNEQFMVAGIDAAIASSSSLDKPGSKRSSANHSNIVMTVLRTRLNASNTFGENLIWMLNRASSLNAEDVCMQLLVLKLLYLLFTTRETAHYFYTNDLKVLVDVFIRELSDLPEESESLRHTYLRVFHPLLTNTQLLTYPYKRSQIRRLLVGLTSHAHLRDISPTTKRLVDRCLDAQWCVDLGEPELPAKEAGRADQLQEHSHTFTIQSIAGGPRTFVEAQTVTDHEGVEIPLEKNHEPYQGAPSSTASTFAVAAATLPKDSAAPVKDLVAMRAQEEGDLQPRLRDRRINSVSSATSPIHLPLHLGPGQVVTSKEAQSESYDDPPRREASGASSLTIRRDLGQRASSARSAPLSPPLVSRSFSNTHRSGHEADSDEGPAIKWNDGSGSSSWQMGMAGEMQQQQHPYPTTLATHDALTRYGSPLSQESTEHFYSLTTSPVDQDQPMLQVEQVLDDYSRLQSSGMGQGDNGSNSGSTGQGRRRRPPAPPSSDNGGLASRKERRALMSSTSETNLPLSRTEHLQRQEWAIDANSLPNSPRAQSVAPSREASPSLDSGQASRRRRPPPPPVNRATKGSRTPSQQANTQTNSVGITDGAAGQDDQAVASSDGNYDMDQSMKYLYVSDRGYGW